jgi:ubiquitin C-terminal hydrolase
LFPYLSGSLQQQLVSFYNVNGQSGAAPTVKADMKPPQRYDLYAISNHYGGLNGGHYTAVVRQPGRKSWVHFDDSRVSEICAMGDAEAEETRVKTKAAYSLFYVSWAVM